MNTLTKQPILKVVGGSALTIGTMAASGAILPLSPIRNRAVVIEEIAYRAPTIASTLVDERTVKAPQPPFISSTMQELSIQPRKRRPLMSDARRKELNEKFDSECRMYEETDPAADREVWEITIADGLE